MFEKDYFIEIIYLLNGIKLNVWSKKHPELLFKLKEERIWPKQDD